MKTSDLNNLKSKFGTEASNKWKTWNYSDRLKVVAAVEKTKQELSKRTDLRKSTVRSKITSFICSKKSRKEFVPLVGNFIEKTKVEPLHLKNNAWQHWHLFVLNYALSKTNVANCETVHDVPETSVFGKFYSCVRYTIKATRLAKKIRKW